MKKIITAIMFFIVGLMAGYNTIPAFADTINSLPQYIISQDEGTQLTARTSLLNFTGTGVTATNTGNAVTVNITGGGGGGGTVTSVAMTVPTGLTISGSPITTSGTLAVALDTGYVIPLQTTLDGFVPYTGATQDVDLGNFGIELTEVRANSSAGLLLESNSGTDIGLLGAGGGTGVTWYGNHNFDLATQDTLAGFIGSGKTLSSITIGTGLTLSGGTLSTSAGTITGSGANGRITYWTGTSTISGSNAFSWNDLTKTFQITNGASPAKRALLCDGLSFDCAFGDISSGGNNTSLYVGDSSQNIQFLGGDGLGNTGAVLDIYTNLSAGNGAIVNMGDVSQLVNATVFSVNDQIQQIQAVGNNYRGMRLDFASDILTFGDVGQSTSGGLNVGSIEIGAGGVFNMWGVDGAGTLSPFFASLGGGDYSWGDINGVGSGSTLSFFESSGGVWSFNQGSIQFNGIDYLFPASQGSTGQALVLQNNTGKLEYENVPRSLFQQTQSITIAATTTPTSVFGTGQGSLVIPANSAYAGATYEIDVYGYYQAAGAQTLDYKIQMMGTNLAPAVTPTPFGTAGTPFAFRAHFTITIRTTGVSGQGAIEGYIKFDKNDGNNLTFELNSTALPTIDTTVGHTTDLIMNWSSNNATNSLTILRAEVNQTR